jgi:hypothetical protein
VKPGLDPGLCEMAVVVASNYVTLTAMRIGDMLGLNFSAQVRGGVVRTDRTSASGIENWTTSQTAIEHRAKSIQELSNTTD